MPAITATVGREDAANKAPDVRLVQKMLNFHAVDLGVPRVTPDGVPGPKLVALIKAFQDKVVKVRKPDGLIEPGKKTMRYLNRIAVTDRVALDKEWVVDDAPKWIQIAGRELGIREHRGSRNTNQRVLTYISSVPALRNVWHNKAKKIRASDVDETAWCGCFVNWCLQQAGLEGYHGIDGGRARKWVNHGTRLPRKEPRYGAITVVYTKITDRKTGKTKGTNHVGFYVGMKRNAVVLLGGNQENTNHLRGLGGGVTVSRFPGWTVKGFMWPKGASPDD